MKLIRQLKRLQKSEDLTDIEFAAKLGISRITWSRIKNGHAKIHIRLIRGIIRAYPHLTNEVNFYLTKEYTKVHKKWNKVNE